MILGQLEREKTTAKIKLEKELGTRRPGTCFRLKLKLFQTMSLPSLPSA